MNSLEDSSVQFVEHHKGVIKLKDTMHHLDVIDGVIVVDNSGALQTSWSFDFKGME